MVGTATRDIVPPKSALGDFFSPSIATDRFTHVPTLKKQAPRTTMTIDAHSGDNVIADINAATGVAVRSYVTPTLDGNISMTDIGGSTYYYNSDERQSVRNLTDSSGVVVNAYDYTAYGDKIDSLTSGSVNQRYTYTGRELNEVSGDYYFRYRMYGAGIGGFLSRDPRKYIDGMSLYSGWFSMFLERDPKGTSRRGESECKPSGYVINFVNENCEGDCVLQHEKEHVATNSSCCDRLNLCRREGVHTNKECEDAYDAWFKHQEPLDECLALTAETYCLKGLAIELDLAIIKGDKSKCGCLEEINDEFDIADPERLRKCTFARPSKPCPFDNLGNIIGKEWWRDNGEPTGGGTADDPVYSF